MGFSFENMFSSAGRKQDKKFTPIEEFPDGGMTPEQSLIREEEEEDLPEPSFDLGEVSRDEDAGMPPEDGTEYDRLMALARDDRNVMRSADEFTGDVSSQIDADAIETHMDGMGPRPSHRDRNYYDGFMSRPPHGYRGKEHPDKHQKGGDTI